MGSIWRSIIGHGRSGDKGTRLRRRPGETAGTNNDDDKEEEDDYEERDIGRLSTETPHKRVILIDGDVDVVVGLFGRR